MFSKIVNIVEQLNCKLTAHLFVNPTKPRSVFSFSPSELAYQVSDCTTEDVFNEVFDVIWFELDERAMWVKWNRWVMIDIIKETMQKDAV